MTEASKPPIDPETIENWANIRLGHEAYMLDKIQRQNRIVEDTVRGQQGAAGYESTLDDDDMGVSVGNKVTHYHAPPPAPEKKASILPAVLAAAGLATGAGGLGAAGMAISHALTRDPIVINGSMDNPGADPGFGTPVWREGYERLQSSLGSPDPRAANE